MSPLRLTWPSDKALSPNARVHWSVKAKAKKWLRTAWAVEALAQDLGPSTAKRLELHVVFMQRDRRPRDLDNLLASAKAGLDGLADVLKVDDSNWSLRIEKGLAPKGSPAHVLVTIKEL